MKDPGESVEIDALASAFGDAMEKMLKGREKYPPNAFLHRNTVRDVKDEILDAINYLCFLYYKITLIEEALNDASSDNSTH